MDPPETQGIRATGCPYCRVLHPTVAACPRCAGGEAEVAARMLDREGVHAAVVRAVDAYDGSRAALDALLHLLFVHGASAIEAMRLDGRCDLDRLRRDDARMHDS